MGYVSITKSPENPKISAIARETKKLRFFSKGPTCPKILYLKPQLFSILWQKEFLKYINSQESNGSLKSFKNIKVQSYSVIFIHSLANKNDKNVPLIVCDFHTKWGKRDTLSFFKRLDFKVSYLKLRVAGLSGEKFTFSTPLGQPKFPGILDFVYINVVLLINFPERFESCFYFEYSRS